jgi:hypothetical protein
VAALGVHQDRVDQERIALPLEPGPLRPAGLIGRIPAFQHQPLRHARVARRRRGAQRGQLGPGGEGLHRRQIDAGRGEGADERLQPRAPLGEAQGADVLAVLGQQVIGADAGGMGRDQLGVDALAVQPLLQVGERRRAAVPHHQQFAVQRAIEVQRRQHVGKGARNVVAGAGVKSAKAALADRLDADAVPLPFGGVVGGVQPGQVHHLVDRLSQHHRPETALGRGVRPLGALFQPGE